MSYLSNCESDVFISYAHFDDAPMFEGERGWVQVFHQALEVRLRQLLGEEALVWRDPKLTGNEYFEDTLEKRLLKTALLLSVVSPRYVKSDSCRKEIEAFCRGAAQTGGVRFQDKARLLKVLKTEVARQEIPLPLQPLLGYEFYTLDQAKRPREFRLPPTVGDESGKVCLNTLEDLAYDIKLTLEALRHSQTDATANVAQSARAVYIADTVSELRPQCDQLRHELRHRGYVVYPCEAAPENGASYRAFVAAELAKASLSVHLIGSLYGVTLEGESRSTIEVQIEEAGRIAATGGLRRVLWLPEGLQQGEERQQHFLDVLQREAANQPNTELVQTSIENLKTYLLRKLTEAVTSEPTDGPGESPLLVYLIHDRRDSDDVGLLRDALMASGYEVKPSYFEGDETELREYHQEMLVECAGVVIYYGAANELWVQRKLADLRKAFGLGRQRPYRAKAIVVGAPARADKAQLRTQEALVIQATQAFSAQMLASFVGQLASSG